MGITVSAIAVGINSQNVKYTKNNQDKSVKEELDDLYSKADECYGYSVGDEITVSGDQYYVIANSPATQDYVTAIKAEPLTVAEVNQYGSGLVNNYQQSYPGYSPGEAYPNGNYGYVAYYNAADCGYPEPGATWVRTGCKSDYNDSDVKKVVDNWSSSKLNNKLKQIDGYSARLIKLSELNELGYDNYISGNYYGNDNEYSWLSGFTYSTMTPYNIGSVYAMSYNWRIGWGATYTQVLIASYIGAVRPVINVYKSAISS